MQMSFASGEISPLLHARVDLARYATGLAELKNMIVLPTGGVTRRAGFASSYDGSLCGTYGNQETRLIPFEYNSTDSVLLEFGEKIIRVWEPGATFRVLTTLTSPYALPDVKTLRYVQSGNVIFIAHKNYKPQMLTRHTLTSWSIKDLPYKNGPWIDGAEWNADVYLSVYGTGDVKTVYSNWANIFSAGLVGTFLKIEYAVEPKTETLTSGTTEKESGIFEVKGTLNVQTSGDWTGIISVDRRTSTSGAWVTVRQYDREDTNTQGQWDFTITETEAGVIYRVRARHEGDTSAKVIITASGFLKSEIYKIASVKSSYEVTAERQGYTYYGLKDEININELRLWSMGAWGELQGYPCSVCMYQDRLIFAGSKYQPQTIWMSRTGDYADFSTSDPLSDDDAVTLTLAGSVSDGIHSLVASSDLLAFTRGGEWKIRGEGSSGAITPTALTAHQQTNIGTKDIQPLTAGGRIILVQSQGRKVYALGYDLNTDGYAGSEISILSGHIFAGKEIISMAYQREPDSLLWFVLDDGTAAVCTYNPEHEVIGWSRHEVSRCKLKTVSGITSGSRTAICCTADYADGANILLLQKDRTTSVDYSDIGQEYDSIIRTLRLNMAGNDGEMFTAKKLISRVIISALKSSEAWVAPGEQKDEGTNWERRRRVKFSNTEYLEDADVQLDNGFSEYACVQIRNSGNRALTIAAITPKVTAGG